MSPLPLLYRGRELAAAFHIMITFAGGAPTE
jgi:hypothetical protein